MKACVLGLGRAGLPLAAVMADAGVDIAGFDIDAERCRQINAGKNPIPEERGLTELIFRYGGKRIAASPDIMDAKDATAYIVVVPLFLNRNNRPDFKAIKTAFQEISGVLKDQDLVVLETTVPPGTTDGLIKRMLDKTGKKYHLAYSPERIMTGVSISRFRDFPKVVGGITEEATEKAARLYRMFSKNVIEVSDARCAEMVKVSEGVYRDVNISLANELYRVCEDIGVDFWRMRDAAKHEFCDIHEPGMVGGHCIPVYPWFLINEHDVPIIRLARGVNEDMTAYYAEKACEIAEKGGKVGVIGLSYRSGVRESRFTKAHQLIKELKKRGMKVFGHDPLFTDDEVRKIFKIIPLKDPTIMDAIILANRTCIGVEAEKTVDVKNSLMQTGK